MKRKEILSVIENHYSLDKDLAERYKYLLVCNLDTEACGVFMFSL